MAEEDTLVQDMMTMMVVIMGIAIIGQVLQVQAAPEVPTNRGVSVALKNPPAEAENWSLSLTDWDVTVAIHFIGRNGKERLDIAEVATFEIPEGVTFPLRIIALQITKWNEARTALQVLYETQSFRPYLWDFDKMEWSTTPDPSYREAFLNAFGHSYFDVSQEAFIGAPANRNVAVTLRNPPSGATKWLMNIIDHSVSYYQTSGEKGIAEAAAFEVEQGWFPLRIEIRVEGVAGAIIYHIQSFSTAEPNYKDISINAYGNYHFDVSQEALTVMEVMG